MHRIDGPGATPDHKFTEGDPANAVPATVVTNDWLNALQEEVAAVIESGGGALDKNNNAQLLAKINSLISAAIPANSPQGVRGAASNLKLSTTGLSAAVAISADELTVENGTSVFRTLGAVAVTASFANAGANGLDVGVANSQTAATWYSVWVIWNGTTVSSLLSLSATSPTLPAGYTYKARVGWVRTDGTANKYPLSFIQVGRTVQYKVTAATNTPALPNVASGVLGSVTAPTWAAVSVSSCCPPTASKVFFVQSVGGVPNVTLMLAPNNQYGNAASTSNPPPFLGNGGTASGCPSLSGWLVLESSNIYAASSASCVINIIGFEDNF